MLTLLSGFLARSKAGLRRLVLAAALTLLGALAAGVGLGFATAALFEVWRRQYGAVDAALGLSALYFLAAIVLFLSLALIGRKQPAAAAASILGQTPDGAADPLRSAAEGAAASQAAALAMGVEVAKQLSPLQLALLAAISGFVAGRRI